jgi:hypothetical protein
MFSKRTNKNDRLLPAWVVACQKTIMPEKKCKQQNTNEKFKV